jgi:DNA-3-methyladenine glycosylase I
MTYCEAVREMPDDSPHIHYHDQLYGFPIESDDELFGRLILEINQAGLSWTTILNKAENFRKAYSGFSIEKIAAYNEQDIQRLLSDSSIIRNKLKVNAAIYNARVILEFKEEFGSFKNWLDSNHTLHKQEWVKLFKKHFKFTGGEITGEFLMSTGYLPGAHEESCPVFEEVKAHRPKWMDS